jgi:hypothetical protein
MQRIVVAATAVLCLLLSIARAEARPVGCPAAWCGCWLARHFGLNDKRLWRAINWARLWGHPARGPAPGVVVVWPHHVGVVTAAGSRSGTAMVLSGNDGHRVRERERSLRGAVAFRAANERPVRLGSLP